MIKRLILVTICVIGSMALRCQEFEVSGYVYEQESMNPLSLVNLSVLGSSEGGTTKQNGFFRFNVGNPPIILIISHLGYIKDTIKVDKNTTFPMRLNLKKGTKEIGQIIVSAKWEPVQKVIKSDTLHILDYAIKGNLIIFVSNPNKDKQQQILYLASLNGDTISSRIVKNSGKKLKFPENPRADDLYLFQDCFNEVHLLTKDKVWQLHIKDDLIYPIYPSDYSFCMKYLFPIKCELNGKYFFQLSNSKYNHTFFSWGGDSTQLLKAVYDEFGNMRYLKSRNVAAPIIKYDDQIVIFDFFLNKMEFFDDRGNLVKELGISFHLKEIRDFLYQKVYDLDKNNFTQQIISDHKANKVYSLWVNVFTGKTFLKEINMGNGEIHHVFEFPENRFVKKIQIHDDVIYFLDKDKKYPFYQNLYRMPIIKLSE